MKKVGAGVSPKPFGVVGHWGCWNVGDGIQFVWIFSLVVYSKFNKKTLFYINFV